MCKKAVWIFEINFISLQYKTNNMRAVKLDLTTIRAHKDDRVGMNYLGIELIVRSRHRSGAITNYSITRIANIAGCSRKTAREAMAWGFARRYCRMDGTRVIFPKAKAHPHQTHRGGKKLTGRELELLTSLKNAVKILKLAIVQDKIHSMEYVEHRKVTANPLQQAKLEQKLSRQAADGINTPPSGERTFTNALSYGKIAGMVGCSLSTAVRLMTFAREEKIIRRKRRKGIRVLNETNFKKYPYLYDKWVSYHRALYGDCNFPSGVFCLGRRLYYQEPNQYSSY